MAPGGNHWKKKQTKKKKKKDAYRAMPLDFEPADDSTGTIFLKILFLPDVSELTSFCLCGIAVNVMTKQGSLPIAGSSSAGKINAVSSDYVSRFLCRVLCRSKVPLYFWRLMYSYC